jgi:hypothetical protein
VISGVFHALPGVEAVGEVRSLFGLGWGIGILCSCGEPLRACPHWEAVLERAYGPSEDRRQFMLSVARLHDRVTRLRHVGAVVSGRLDQADADAIALYRQHLGALYSAVGEVTGASVVVDSSKSPGYAAALAGVPEVDLKLVHLVRDPRAVAYSWQRTKLHTDFPDAREMTRYRPSQSTLQWDLWNAAIGRVLASGVPGLRLRYEDFVADPVGRMGEVARLGGVDPALLGNEIVSAGESHMVHGNPGRHAGPTRITADDAWKTDLSSRDGLVATMLAAPWLGRFGYPLRWR